MHCPLQALTQQWHLAGNLMGRGPCQQGRLLLLGLQTQLDAYIRHGSSTKQTQKFYHQTQAGLQSTVHAGSCAARVARQLGWGSSYHRN